MSPNPNSFLEIMLHLSLFMSRTPRNHMYLATEPNLNIFCVQLSSTMNDLLYVLIISLTLQGFSSRTESGASPCEEHDLQEKWVQLNVHIIPVSMHQRMFKVHFSQLTLRYSMGSQPKVWMGLICNHKFFTDPSKHSNLLSTNLTAEQHVASALHCTAVKLCPI